jgi:hypothetical protein
MSLPLRTKSLLYLNLVQQHNILRNNHTIDKKSRDDDEKHLEPPNEAKNEIEHHREIKPR